MEVPEIDIDEFAPLHAAGVAVLDVRQPDEYEEGHVPGAVLVPLGELPDRVDEVPADGPLYVICRSGGRSRKASEFLRAAEIDATNVDGGTAGWIAAGHPVASGPEPS